MKHFAVYTLGRLGLFVASYVVIAGVYLLVTDGDAVPLFWPLVLAIVASSIASIYLLRGPRERFARVVEDRATRASQRLERARAKEDDPET